MSTASFTGSWKLISSEMRSSGGDVQYPLGEDCEGRLVIDADGNFSAQLMRPGRPEFASGDIVRGTDEEIRAAYQGYVAFWAKIEVDEAKKEFTYDVEGSLFPNWIGHRNLRYYQFDGNRLTLSTPAFLMAQQEVTGVLIWERVSC
jgi:hypothetical protein